MSETKQIMPAIMLAVGKHAPHVRLFRNNVGMGWTGEAVKKGNVVIIANPRPLHAGLCEGSSDLIGWTEVEITPEMVGKKVAVFTALEVKTLRGRTSQDQANFVQRVREAGGIAAVVRTEEEALKAIS